MKFLAMAVILSGALSAQDAGQLIRHVSETYKNLQSYHFESEYEGTSSGEWQGSWSRGRTTLVVASPDRVRFESIDQMGWYVVVSDGKTLSRATGHTREYSRVPVSGPLFDTKGGGQEGQIALRRLKAAMESYWKLTDNLKTAQVLREETLDLEGHDVPCTDVRAEYAPPRGAERIHSTMRTFWIDKQRSLLLQEERVTEGNLSVSAPFEHIQSTYKVRYTRASINQPIPNSLFAYEPPANFREVDTLESAMRRALSAPREMIGKPAPDLTANTLDGKPVTLASLRGKPVLLDFWATWCAPCRKQMPLIARIYRETKDQGLLLFGVDDDETPEKAIGYLKENRYEWPSLFDGETKAARETFKVRAIPTLVLINKDGEITEYQVGAGPETEKAIQAALHRLGIEIP